MAIFAPPAHTVSGGTTGYTIDNSLRFDGSNDYLSRTFGTPSNNSVWTFSTWVKRGKLGALQNIIAATTDSNNYAYLAFNASDQLNYSARSGGANVGELTSTRVFRDPTAWLHIVIVRTSSTAQTIYVNNEAVTMTGTAITSSDTFINGPRAHYIGQSGYSSHYFDGYRADTYFVDTSGKTQSDFGETNADGVWVPIAYTGSYGNNGFHLDFADGTSTTTLGYDAAGSNDWTLNGMTRTAGVSECWMTDTPTNNFATLNPLDLPGSPGTYSNGNLAFARTTTSQGQAYSSITMSSGKWYCEVTIGSDITDTGLGIITGTANPAANRYIGQDTFTYGYYQNGNKVNNASYVAYGSTYTTGDVIGIILDADNGKLYFSKNGVVQNSGDPVGGTGYAYSSLTGPYRFALGSEASGNQDINFGQGNVASAVYDSASGGTFKYTPPTGFKALSTANLPAGSLTTSGSFTGNSSTDGPFVWLNGNPLAMTINGNAVTFGTHADKTAGGFKVRSSSSSYNTSGSNTFSVTSSGELFNAPNTAQGNP